MTYELIIIGAGPAGISMACEAIASGIESKKIIILEKSEAHSWSIRKFYPEKKLVTANYKGKEALCNGVMCIDDSSKEETLSYLDKKISDNKLKVNYKETVWKIEKKEDTFEIETSNGNYVGKVCAIAIGMMGKPNKPDYRIPAEIRERFGHDISSKPIEGNHVLVVGGGDSASEYAQYLSQEGKEVSFSYRKNELSRMNDINRDSLLALGERGKVKLMLESEVEEVKPSGSGVEVIFKDGRFPALKVDHVVLALGGTTPKNFLSVLGIEFNEGEPVIKEGYETSVPGLFLIGDLSAGKKGGSIISAFNSSHEAMQKICTDYLNCRL